MFHLHGRGSPCESAHWCYIGRQTIARVHTSAWEGWQDLTKFSCCSECIHEAESNMCRRLTLKPIKDTTKNNLDLNGFISIRFLGMSSCAILPFTWFQRVNCWIFHIYGSTHVGRPMVCCNPFFLPYWDTWDVRSVSGPWITNNIVTLIYVYFYLPLTHEAR